MQGVPPAEMSDGAVVEVTDSKIVEMGDVFAYRKITYTHEGGPNRPSCRLMFEVRNRVPICTSAAIEAKPGIPVRAKDLRAIKLDNIRDDAFAAAGVCSGESGRWLPADTGGLLPSFGTVRK